MGHKRDRISRGTLRRSFLTTGVVAIMKIDLARWERVRIMTGEKMLVFLGVNVMKGVMKMEGKIDQN